MHHDTEHHDTSLTKEMSSFLCPGSPHSPRRLCSLSSSPPPPNSQVRTIFLTILSIATKSFFITRRTVILQIKYTIYCCIKTGEHIWRFLFCLQPFFRSVYTKQNIHKMFYILDQLYLQKEDEAHDDTKLDDLEIMLTDQLWILAKSLLLLLVLPQSNFGNYNL